MSAQGKVIVGQYPPGYKQNERWVQRRLAARREALTLAALHGPTIDAVITRREDGTWATPRRRQTLPIVEGEVLLLRTYLGREIDDILY
jgi:hypothetical protein